MRVFNLKKYQWELVKDPSKLDKNLKYDFSNCQISKDIKVGNIIDIKSINKFNSEIRGYIFKIKRNSLEVLINNTNGIRELSLVNNLF